jgi:uncharacterized protein (DUF2252 family)
MKLSRMTIARFASLADRCHAADSAKQVATYAKSALRPGVWRQFPRDARKTLLRALFQRHAENRSLYRFVTGPV